MQMDRFRQAFECKRRYLIDNLDVSTKLLADLQDKRLLSELQVESIRVKDLKADKVYELIGLLSQRPDNEFDHFCNALRGDGQSHVVKVLAPELIVELETVSPSCSASFDHVTASPSCSSSIGPCTSSQGETSMGELKEIIEPDYGFPFQLCRNGILTREQSAEIQHLSESEFHLKQKRVRLLLELVVPDDKKQDNEPCLKVLHDFTAFTDALRDTDQCHVVNYIRAGGNMGNIVDNHRPLTEQQRRRLCPSPILTMQMNSRKDELLKRLVHDKVISQLQHDDVIKQVDLSDMNSRLLIIMERRSLANVVRFINYLRETGQTEVVKLMLEPGVFVGITTEINDPKMTNKDKKTKESFFLAWFWKIWPFGNKSNNHLNKGGCEIRTAKQTNSILWYIKCETLESLDSLWNLYISGDLVDVFQNIFNRPFQSSELIKLTVYWNLKEYDSCKAMFKSTSCLPFGSQFDRKTRDREDTMVNLQLLFIFNICLKLSI